MLEIVAVIFTLISVWLTRKQNIWCWLTGIIGTGCYFFIFKHDKSWGNMSLQIVFIGQCLYGWLLWGKKDNKVITQSESLYITIGFLLTGVLFLLLCSINLTFDFKLGYFDMITTSLSLAAITLTAHKKLENWICWAIANSIYVVFFITSGHYWSAALYLGLFINTYFGYKEWKKHISQPTY